MFQKKINSILSTQLYNIDVPKQYIHRFVSHNYANNKLNQYANGKVELSNVKFILQAISYNSYKDYPTWNVKPTSLYMFNKGKQVISDKLCNKIIKNIKPDFNKCIEEVMMDYHILFDENGKPISYKNYPPIYKAMGYILTFPITIFEKDFTSTEMKELTKFLKGQIFIIILPHSIKLYRNINKGKYETIEFSKDLKGLISTVLYFNNKPTTKINEWIDILTTKENVEKLKKELF